MKIALIVGAGPGISIAFARKLAVEGFKVCLASRNLENLSKLAATVEGSVIFDVDCANNESILSLFQKFDEKFDKTPPSVVLYNTSAGFALAGDCGSEATANYSAVASALQVSAIGVIYSQYVHTHLTISTNLLIGICHCSRGG